MKRASLFSVLLLAAAWLATPALADNKSVDFGDYQVHYNVFPSTFLTPEVAKANNLKRSRGLGIVNIAIMEETEESGLRTVPGQVEGKALNSLQQPTYLAFRRVQEGDDVYFLAQYQYSAGETMVFEITARPTGHNQDLNVRFSQELFND
ncbi:protein of unknown function [Marinobacter daqiaonensis]|uniref:DUF4426 domain-containing protein n=1 Tax=Marinobacter daqiaonensis TaxID=650891 RepID=A0A1I6JW60_9GAMM|nr:DUF4426 domain-containing protein [Marinobacter daqiaonensis]SFR82790.1 protein of unknown function [Marinobacter daqiaonensis]